MIWGVSGHMIWGVSGHMIWGVSGHMIWGVMLVDVASTCTPSGLVSTSGCESWCGYDPTRHVHMYTHTHVLT